MNGDNVNVGEGHAAAMYVASPQGGEVDIAADRTGTRIDKCRASGR
jgi:hypothetical protein